MTQNSPDTIHIIGEIDIAAPIEQVYAALDMRSPSNRYLARGMSVTPVDDTTDQFEMVNPEMPELVFTMTEVKAIDPTDYHLRTGFPGGEPLGVMTGDSSAYQLSVIDAANTRVVVDVKISVLPMSEEQFEHEFSMLSISVNDDLARTKALLEDGAAAAEKAGALDEFFDTLDALIDLEED